MKKITLSCSIVLLTFSTNVFSMLTKPSSYIKKYHRPYHIKKPTPHLLFQTSNINTLNAQHLFEQLHQVCKRNDKMCREIDVAIKQLEAQKELLQEQSFIMKDYTRKDIHLNFLINESALKSIEKKLQSFPDVE